MSRFEIDETILMRTLTLSDAQELFRVVDGNRQHLREWLPWLDRNTQVSDSEDFIRSTILQDEQGKGFVCGIFLNDALVGTCGYHPIEGLEVTIGYWLAASATGKGIITRCTKCLICYAFDHLKLHKVNIPVAVENVRSRAVCERLNLKVEGIKPGAEYLYGRYVDHVLYCTTPIAWDEGTRT